jgi:hypothetical protein
MNERLFCTNVFINISDDEYIFISVGKPLEKHEARGCDTGKDQESHHGEQTCVRICGTGTTQGCRTFLKVFKQNFVQQKENALK